VGHDRGARICHRLAVDLPNTTNFTILGAVLLDIVPTLIQWQSCINPLVCMGSFHWSFLANVEVATAMIKAQGGGAWVRLCFDRWVGKSPAGLAKLKEDDAMEIYAEAFKRESVIRASCDDYRAGAMEDSKLQVEDQSEEKKVDVDVLAVYSSGYLGGRYDVRKVWEEWMGKGGLEVLGIGEGIGHFVAEEAPEETAAAVVEFYNKHVSEI
jgi:pimeloyl-ACP methyl ester carboxylesterase